MDLENQQDHTVQDGGEYDLPSEMYTTLGSYNGRNATVVHSHEENTCSELITKYHDHYDHYHCKQYGIQQTHADSDDKTLTFNAVFLWKDEVIGRKEKYNQIFIDDFGLSIVKHALGEWGNSPQDSDFKNKTISKQCGKPDSPSVLFQINPIPNAVTNAFSQDFYSFFYDRCVEANDISDSTAGNNLPLWFTVPAVIIAACCFFGGFGKVYGTVKGKMGSNYDTVGLHYQLLNQRGGNPT